ncbi:MAG: hypothetical protein ABIJ16_06410 [Bacteroidota bacterium]
MKKLLITVSFAFLASFLFAQCNEELQKACVTQISGTTYLKDFKVKLTEAKKSMKQPMAIFNISLTNGNHYRFTTCDDTEKEAQSIIQIYDSNVLIGSNQNIKTGKIYPAFDFLCSKTGTYTVYISYDEGKEGCSVTMLSLVKDQK